MTKDALKVEPVDGASSTAVDVSKCGRISKCHLAALGWAFTDLPTIQAYQRATGESLSWPLWKYRQWAEENIVGQDQSPSSG